MKILSLSLDNSIFNKASALAARTVEYGNLVEKYTVIAPSQKNEEIELSGKATVYGSGGGDKFTQLIKIYNLAKKLLREEKYNIITAQDQYYLALIGLYLGKKFNLGLEIQAHGFEKYYGLRKLIAKYVLPRANAVRCVSQRLKEQLINEFKAKEEKITVVPIYSELVAHNSNRIIREDKKFVFFTANRLVPVKNISLQIEAMAEVVKKYSDAELWIAGDGPERIKLEKLSGGLRDMNYVKFFGWQENLSNYYNQADAFLLTSNAEGWGLAVVEAASFGLPIIMTDVGCAGEVIKNGESGLIIPAGGKEKLVEAMLTIIEDGNLRKKLGENAKSAAGRLPGKEQTLELYKKSWEIAVENRMSAQGGSAMGGKLLILTQKVDINDDVLGFFHRWIIEFAKNCQQVIVICLYKGESDLPNNVKVLSLGKENGESKIKYLVNFYKYIWRERKNYDTVFAHMNYEYVILGGIFWRLIGKKIGLWYAHGRVSLGLKIAEKLTNKIFTASEESCRVNSKKIEIIGHGIDTEKFNLARAASAGLFRIISVGRISPIKKYETLIAAAKILKDKNFVFSIKIAGAPIFEKDKNYLDKLKELLINQGLSKTVEFIGAIPHGKIEEFYREGDLFINLSRTGSIDKAILEAMAGGLKILTANEAFKNILPDQSFTEEDPKKIAEKIIFLSTLESDEKLRNYVVENHNLKNLFKKIIEKLC